MAEQTPYDTGQRLDPHAWVTNGIVVPDGHPRFAEDSEFGRVDFDGDDGTTILTLHVEPADNGYRMVIDQHSEEYLHVVGANEPPMMPDPSLQMDPEYRTRQMMLLHAGLGYLGKTYGDDIFYADDGDPSAFSLGNYTFSPLRVRDGTVFAIEEAYERGTDWADDERVPIGWTWLQKDLVRLPDGTQRAEITAEGSTIPSDIDNLIDRARTWVEQTIRRLQTPDIDFSPYRDGPGPSRPGPGSPSL